MEHLRHTLTIVAVLAVIACGPRQLGTTPGNEDEAGSETTSTSDSSDAETSTESTTVGFVPDVAAPGKECDPWSQDCPDGQKCVAYSSSGGVWDANKCVPVMGDGKPGEPCWYGGVVEATDDCDETSACWDAVENSGDLIGLCRAFCAGYPDNPECPAGSDCLLSEEINLCVPPCDPILQDCEAGFGCYYTGVRFECAFTNQDSAAGEPCGFINDCAAGNVCVVGEALPSCAESSCCASFCNLELGDPQCESVPGTSCVPFFEQGMAPMGYELVGACVLP